MPRQKYPYFNLRFRKEEPEDERMAGEKRRIVEDTVHVDRSVFRKSAKEKELLKALRLEYKRDVAMKRR